MPDAKIPDWPLSRKRKLPYQFAPATIQAFERVVDDWDGKNLDTLRAVLRRDGLTDAQIETMDESAIHQHFAVGHKAIIIKLGGRPHTTDNTIIESGGHGGGDKPILSSRASMVYQTLLEQPEYKGITGPELITELGKKGVNIELSELTSRYIPELKPYGVENTPRKGYRIPASKRPPQNVA